jgi:hypothetical protein
MSSSLRAQDSMKFPGSLDQIYSIGQINTLVQIQNLGQGISLGNRRGRKDQVLIYQILWKAELLRL